ncbi:MAG: glycosyltransferase family 9 protein [Candidatus Eremiobacteraeota bacterium]|nr:glycosyltransferase family 9 protein [Candidatus Eremiobacteraeota bacterium]
MTVVALRALGLGDFLTAVPVFRALGKAFPQHDKLLAAPKALAPLATLVDGIDEVIDAAPLSPLTSELYDADIAIDLHGKGPQSHELLIATRPRRFIAFENDRVPQSYGQPRWRPDEHEVDRWCRLMAEHHIAADPADLRLPKPKTRMSQRVRAPTLLHPGAKSASRRWPIERWIAVARHERSRGRQVVLTGNSQERATCEMVAHAARIPMRDVFAGRTDSLELASLVAHARRVVCGDTGVAHLATAFMTPSVLLFGPTDPAHWGPTIDKELHRVIWYGTTGDPHGDALDSSLSRITVADVLEQLAELA